MAVKLIKGARETFNDLLLCLTKKKEKAPATVWLPDDVMFEILVKLPNASLRHCLYASKQFHNIISDLKFERARPPIRPALIMHVQVSKDHLNLYLVNDWYDRASTSSVVTIERPDLVPDLTGLHLVDSLNEMLCFVQTSKYDSIIHIYNSQINQWIATPPFKPASCFPERIVPLCGLYYHEPSRCYRVFSLQNDRGFHVHDLGTGFWRKTHGNIPYPGPSDWIEGAVLINGCLHWSTIPLFDEHRIVAFDINSEEFYIIWRPITRKERSCGRYQPLIETKYGLGCPVWINDALHIWVFTDYYGLGSWTLLYCIYDYHVLWKSERLLRGPMLELLLSDEGEHWFWNKKKIIASRIKIYNCEIGESKYVKFDASIYQFTWYRNTGCFFWQVPRSIRQRSPERKKVLF
ncbi:F-box protein [Rhynchospora pubera]|uniref:F-box protein n=1 Tax=Rhynchospora pubera TaxID=906938 RepID=A0AAV8E2N7_9POAL|nr:F-box protein [Rhynchospora pubera]